MMRAAMGWGLLVWLSLSLPMSEAAPPDGASPVPKRATASELDEIQGALDKAEQDRAAMLRRVDDKSRQMAEEFKAIQKFLQKNAPWMTPDHKPEPDLKPVPDVLPPAPPPQSDALPTISIPEKVTGKKGQWIKIPATTNGGEVRWVSLTDGLSVFPTELLKSSATGIVSAIEDGEYRVLAYTALGNVPSDPVECLVVIGVGPRPPPVPPDPKPEPKPEPDPHPVAKKLYLVTIDEWQKRTPDIARVLGDDQDEEDEGSEELGELTQAGEFLGTPDYMAPEQAENPRNADTRSDLYSLGATLFYLLAGHPVFAGGTIVQKLRKHLTTPAPQVNWPRHWVSR